MPNPLVLTCLACSRKMQILAEGVPHAMEVKCARCGATLGIWRDLLDGEGVGGSVPAGSAARRSSRRPADGDDPSERSALAAAAPSGGAALLTM